MQRRFEIGHCLGKGGFGEVYRAVVHSSGGMEHEVAIKLLHPDLLHNETARDRMRDEGRLLSRLNHPAIVRCYALTVIAGRIALVTEFVHGADLSVCCKMTDPIPARALLQVLGKVSAALDLALNATAPGGQPMQLIHRDIKPGNIRVGHHGQAFLLDFGIARSDTIERNVHTAADLVVGSLLYMAPERFGPKGASGASDVFGLGCCLFEGLVGSPFYGASSLRDISRLANESSHYQRFLEQRMGELPESVPNALKSLCLDCLLYDPNKRPTAAKLGFECERLADQLGGMSIRTWARAQHWSEDPGDPAALTGQTLEELPLPPPGKTLQALMPGLDIREGSAQTTAYVELTSDGMDTWSDEDGIHLPGKEEESVLQVAPRATLPRKMASSMSALAMILLTIGLVAFGWALYGRWSENVVVPIETEVTPVVLSPVGKSKLPEVKDQPEIESPKEKTKTDRVSKEKRKESIKPSSEPVVRTNNDAPELIPTAATKVLAPGNVQNGGEVPVELRGKGKVYNLPTKVPHGAYWIWTDRGSGWVKANRLTLSPGDDATVTCFSGKQNCKYEIQ